MESTGDIQYSATYSSFVESVGASNDTDGGVVEILDNEGAKEKL